MEHDTIISQPPELLPHWRDSCDNRYDDDDNDDSYLCEQHYFDKHSRYAFKHNLRIVFGNYFHHHLGKDYHHDVTSTRGTTRAGGPDITSPGGTA